MGLLEVSPVYSNIYQSVKISQIQTYKWEWSWVKIQLKPISEKGSLEGKTVKNYLFSNQLIENQKTYNKSASYIDMEVPCIKINIYASKSAKELKLGMQICWLRLGSLWFDFLAPLLMYLITKLQKNGLWLG